jgi:hypothetical protein
MSPPDVGACNLSRFRAACEIGLLANLYLAPPSLRLSERVTRGASGTATPARSRLEFAAALFTHDWFSEFVKQPSPAGSGRRTSPTSLAACGGISSSFRANDARAGIRADCDAVGCHGPAPNRSVDDVGGYRLGL